MLCTLLNSSLQSKPQNNDGHLIWPSLTIVKDNLNKRLFRLCLDTSDGVLKSLQTAT